ncbi:MAG: hypothetical protein QXH67_04635 [Candidatus Bathyarchaeia archaeon]
MKEMMKGVKTDKFVISWILLILMLLSYLVPLGLPVNIRTPTRQVYQFVESLSAVSKPLLLSLDFTAGGAPEVYPTMLAFVRHAVSKGIKLVVVGVGTDEATALMNRLFDESGIKQKYKYGEDYVGIGYIPGGEIAVATLATNFQQIVKRDAYGNDISELPLIKDVKDYSSFSAVVPFDTAGVLMFWVRNWTPYPIPLFCAFTSGSEPRLVTFYNAGQIKGYISGIRGGAEYELLTGNLGTGVKSMDLQSLTHLYAFFLVIVGNLTFLWLRRKK